MKWWIIQVSGLILCLWLGSSVMAQPQIQFDQSNALLREGRILEALEGYQSIAETGATSGSLLLNIGICYVQLDSLGKAKGYFKSAARFPEVSEKAQKGLSYVEERFAYTVPILPKMPWDYLLEWHKEAGVNSLIALTLVLFYLGIGVTFLRWFVKMFDVRWIRYVQWGIFILAFLGGVASLWVYEHNERYKEAVIIVKEIPMYELPNTESSVINQAYEGYDVIIDKEKSSSAPEWKFIQLRNGMTGWISEEAVFNVNS